MKYENYTVEDFLAEESFQQYCAATNEAAIVFWNNALEQEPQIEETFKEAINWYNLLNAQQGNLKEQTELLQKRIHQLGQEYNAQPHKLIRMRGRWWAAACIILILCAGSYFYLKQSPQKQIAKTENAAKIFKNDIAPGGNRAILTLANGSKIILDSAKNGSLARQGNSKIIKLNDGQLSYQLAEGTEPATIQYNTISTPRGGQYQLRLSDGSKVWLNAASSLKFPSAFTGKQRSVELTGEGYFEITHNAAMPFKVKNESAEITVLGTHFNINAYDHESSLKVTLLEGSVKVKGFSVKGERSTVIKPGQQAQVSLSGHEGIKVQAIDVDEVMAWKDGFFEFENMELPAIMRQIERWYDVSVEYKNANTKERFGGRISRNLSLSKMLHLLETNRVHFNLDGNKITVL